MAGALIDPSAWGLGSATAVAGPKRPRHVAVIMDGNGRWAKARAMPRAFGHKAGVDALRRTVEAAGDLGIEVLTVYAFSTENWRRPNEEIEALFALLRGYIRTDLDRLDKAGVRICVLGQRDDLPKDILDLIDTAQSQTIDNTVMTLVIAFNYGGQAEIAEAARQMAFAAQRGDLDPHSITTETLAAYLPTHRWPDPDLVIRTSGEQRLSNFLIWQTAYSEFVVLDTLWPDFGRAGLEAALDEYARRQRRFGGV